MPEWQAILALVALGGFLVLGWRHQVLARRLRDVSERLVRQEEKLAGLQSELAALCKASVGAGQRIVQLSDQVRRLGERQDRTELQTMSERSFERAIERVREGGDVETLMRECGLTRGEAELLITVHGMDAA